ncbi:di-N-acetylchitobiase-like [Asterias rubens]|uniref:di-N-acetylchitobiase-like n=1 Tax=Asterias rubens TaxID=7604 RepID=UPI00145592CD|nr:di-N-acetylchitobiase-like [Asterias rubens]
MEFSKICEVFGIFLLCSLLEVQCLVIEETVKESSDCPCSDPGLCDVIKTPPRKEVFGFWVGGSEWMKYDWNALTTVVMVGHYDAKMMCYAHSKGVRVTLLGNFPLANLSSVSDRNKWIIEKVAMAVDLHLDGINLDLENPIDASQAPLLTSFVDETTKAFHLSIPNSQVTFDAAWSSGCIDGRCYDYVGIAKSCDFLFVMSYDEQSQIFGPCIAMANSPYNKTAYGVEMFLKLGIPAKQLVLGVPWYGYDYKCNSLSKSNVCAIEHVPFRGVNCSDAAGKQINYGGLMQLLAKNATSGPLFNTTYLAPFFNYKDSKTDKMHQIWYDNPKSLTARYEYASKMKLRGVGMWNLDTLDYSDDPTAQDQTKAMWKAIGKYFLDGNEVF